jgi:hypothetical protein
MPARPALTINRHLKPNEKVAKIIECQQGGPLPPKEETQSNDNNYQN